MPVQLSRVASGRLPAWSAAPVPAAQEAADSSHPKTGHWSRMQEQEVGCRNAVRGRFEVSEFCTISFFFVFHSTNRNRSCCTSSLGQPAGETPLSTWWGPLGKPSASVVLHFSDVSCNCSCTGKDINIPPEQSLGAAGAAVQGRTWGRRCYMSQCTGLLVHRVLARHLGSAAVYKPAHLTGETGQEHGKWFSVCAPASPCVSSGRTRQEPWTWQGCDGGCSVMLHASSGARELRKYNRNAAVLHLVSKNPNLLREIPHRVTDSGPLKHVNSGPCRLAVTYADSLHELKGNSLPWLRYHVTSSEDEQPPYPQNISQFAFRLFRGRRFPAPSDKTRLLFSTAAANLRSH